MVLSILLCILSLILLYLGTECLLRGGSTLGSTLQLNPKITGLTLIIAATSAPLLTLSLSSALSGSGGMAIGSIIGSNIFNVCLIIGIIALTTASGIKIRPDKTAILIALASSILIFFLFHDRVISRAEGIVLILLWAVSIVLRIRFGRKEESKIEVEASAEQKTIEVQSWYFVAFWLIAGAILLFAGTRILINEFTDITGALKIGTTTAGLTILAAVCSMPLLVTSMLLVRRKEYELGLGNIIGSNIMNLLGVAGITSLIHPINALSISNFDLYFLIGTSLILLQFFRPKYILKRDEGILLLLMYAVYIYYLWPK